MSGITARTPTANSHTQRSQPAGGCRRADRPIVLKEIVGFTGRAIQEVAQAEQSGRGTLITDPLAIPELWAACAIAFSPGLQPNRCMGSRRTREDGERSDDAPALEAGGRTRTDGLFLTRELLYQLSYSGTGRIVGEIAVVRYGHGPAEAYATVATWPTRRTSAIGRHLRFSPCFASSATACTCRSARTPAPISYSSATGNLHASNARPAGFAAARSSSRFAVRMATTGTSTTSPSTAPRLRRVSHTHRGRRDQVRRVSTNRTVAEQPTARRSLRG